MMGWGFARRQGGGKKFDGFLFVRRAIEWQVCERHFAIKAFEYENDLYTIW